MDIEFKSICSKIRKAILKDKLFVLTIVAVFLGLILGVIIQKEVTPYSTDLLVVLLKFPGEILLRMLKCIILPLVVASVITGLGNINAKSCGKIGGVAVAYYLSTTVIAAILGLCLVSIIKPGSGDQSDFISKDGGAVCVEYGDDGSSYRGDVAVTKSGRVCQRWDSQLPNEHHLTPEENPNEGLNDNYCRNPDGEPGPWCYNAGGTSPRWELCDVPRCGVTVNENTNTLDTIMDLLRAAFPDNIVEATFGKDATELSEITRDDGSTYLKRNLQFKSGINMIGVIVFAIVVGVIMSLYPEESAPLMKVVQSVNDVTMRLVTLVLWYSPIGIFFLIAGQFAGVEDFGEMVAQLGLYVVTVLLGIAIHFFIILPSIFFAFTRSNPIPYYYNMLPALATAFGTASSSATMPVTLKCVEEKNGISYRISRFVIPVGATINMDGTALYEAVACLFIAQVKGISLNFGQVVVTGLTATLAAVGAAGIPSAGLVTMVMVLNAVGLPLDMLAVILTVDWFLDRFRTMTNVMGDALGCAVVQSMCSKELAEMDQDTELQEVGEKS